MKRVSAFILLFILSACTAQPRTVAFNNATYQIQSNSGSAVIYKGPEGSTLQVERSEGPNAIGEIALVKVNDQTYRVTGSETYMHVSFPDGRQLSRIYAENSASGMTAPGITATLEDWDRVDELREIVFHTRLTRQSGQAGWRYLLAALILIFGLFELINPRLAWQISEGWRYENLEPSEIYLGLSRVVGAFLLLGSLLIAFGSWW